MLEKVSHKKDTQGRGMVRLLWGSETGKTTAPLTKRITVALVRVFVHGDRKDRNQNA